MIAEQLPIPTMTTPLSAPTSGNPPRFFIVLWDDDQGMSYPMTWDPDCEGAVCGAMEGDLALFPDRKTAKGAVSVAVKWNALLKAQGKPYAEEFLTSRSSIKVRECKFR